VVNTIVFDIETEGDVELAGASGKLDPKVVTADDAPRNYKKADSITAWVERRNIELVEEAKAKELTLQIKNYWFAKVRMIGYSYRISKNGKPPGKPRQEIVGGNEVTILRDFWDRAKDMFDYRWVSFNGKGYDLPVILVRSILHGIKVDMTTYDLLIHPYQHVNHVDLHGFMPGSLDDIYFYLFKERKDEIDFNNCTDPELEAHLRMDLVMTRNVFERIFNE